MIELIGWAAAMLAILGVVANNRKESICFKIFIISNLLSAIVHFHLHCRSLFLRDIIFVILAVEGFILWKRKR